MVKKRFIKNERDLNQIPYTSKANIIIFFLKTKSHLYSSNGSNPQNMDIYWGGMGGGGNTEYLIRVRRNSMRSVAVHFS